MRKIRVLVVDDSAVVRHALSNQMAKEGDIEIAGVAANGRIALQLVTQASPDVVILDVHMPVMDGLEFLKALRPAHPRLPVIMLSSVTLKSAEITLEALALGANDYVTKPEFASGLTEALDQVCGEILPKIRIFCRAAAAPESRAQAPAPAPTQAARPARAKERVVPASLLPEIVLIGVSTGGPTALSKLVPMLPADFPVPVVIVQHMPTMFTKMLADRLAASSKIGVQEAQGGEGLRAGHAYIAPGGYHLVLEKNPMGVVTRLTETPPVNSCRPSVDVTFESAVPIYKSRILAAILTGMGEDGKRGCEMIVDAGGSVIAQDEATSVVWGMPGSVVHANLASKVLPLPEIAGALDQGCRRGAHA